MNAVSRVRPNPCADTWVVQQRLALNFRAEAHFEIQPGLGIEFCMGRRLGCGTGCSNVYVGERELA